MVSCEQPAHGLQQHGPVPDTAHQATRLMSGTVDRSPPPPPVKTPPPPPASPAPTPPATLAAGGKYAPGQLIWADEFSGYSGATSGIDPDKWSFQNGDGSYWGIKGVALCCLEVKTAFLHGQEGGCPCSAQWLRGFQSQRLRSGCCSASAA